MTEEPITPREQFEEKFGPIDDEQWQWLKEFTQTYDSQQYDSVHPVIHQKWVEGIRVRIGDGTVRMFPLDAVEFVIKQAEISETEGKQYDSQSFLDDLEIDYNRIAIHNTWGDDFENWKMQQADESWSISSGDVARVAKDERESKTSVAIGEDGKDRKEATDGTDIVGFMQSELPGLVADELDRRRVEREERALGEAVENFKNFNYAAPNEIKLDRVEHDYYPHKRTRRWFGWFRRGN